MQSEWLCFEHGGYAAEKAIQVWQKLGGEMPPPATTREAMARTDELAVPQAILLKRSGKFKEVVARRIGAPAAPKSWKDELCDEIPF